MTVPRGKRPIVIATVGSDFRIAGVLPPAILNTAYSQNLRTVGGVPPIVITERINSTTLTGSGLPTGLSFTDNGDGTCTISGTPIDVGTFLITVTCRDSTRRKKSANYTLLVVLYEAIGALVTEDTIDTIITEDTSTPIIKEDR